MHQFTALTITLLLLALCPLQAQIDGDNIFENDQVINIELNFDQVDFWDSLVANYATETYMKADLTLTDETGTYTFQDVGIRLKGNSSYSHPGVKKSFKIDFNEYVSGQNYDGLKKLNFSNGFKDPTMMREKVFFDVCQAAEVPAPRANFANVYFNGTLWGFYTVIEQIDDQFLDWRILDDDGNLFKAGDNFGGGPGGGDEADLAYYGVDQSSYEDLYELKSNEDENDWSDLIDFIDFINNSSSTDFENGLADWIELEEFLRSAALDNIFSNLDSYTGSARNYYVYHNLTTDKWEWIKWDGNESFGSYGGGPGINMPTLALNYHDSNRPLLENIFDSPVLYDQYKSQICYLIENFFNPNYLKPKIDAIRDMIQPSVYADGNKMYSNADFEDNIEMDLGGGGPGGGNTYGLKSFVDEKFDFVSGLLDCSVYSGVTELDIDLVTVYPNPTSSTITIAWGQQELDLLRIYNTMGMEINQVNIQGQSSVELDMSELPPGTYFLVVQSGKNSQVIPVVKG